MFVPNVLKKLYCLSLPGIPEERKLDIGKQNELKEFNGLLDTSASKIQNFFRTRLKEMKANRPEDVVGKWIEEHGKNFVAHAIWDCNVQSVMEFGAVLSAEQLLRIRGFVEYEVGGSFGDRGYAQIDPIVKKAWLEKQEIPPFRYIYPHTKEDMINFFENWLEILQKIEKRKGRLQEEWNFKTTEDIDCLVNTEIYRKFKQVEDKFQGRFRYFAIFVDHSRLMREMETLDQNLTRLWDAFCEYLSDLRTKGKIDENVEKHRKMRFTGFLAKTRDLEIDPLKLNCDIRALKGKIHWSYGRVAVLRGNPDTILSAKRQYWGSDTGESFLLQTFENGGKFFELPLDQQDTVVMGPRELLNSYIKTYPDRKFVFVERLSRKQFDFFGVFDEDCKKWKQSLEKCPDDYFKKLFDKWRVNLSSQKNRIPSFGAVTAQGVFTKRILHSQYLQKICIIPARYFSFLSVAIFSHVILRGVEFFRFVVNFSMQRHRFSLWKTFGILK